MITNNDLYDLSAVFVEIRNDIRYTLNGPILYQLILALKKNEKAYADNQFRRALSSINGLDYKKWHFIYHNNVYTSRRILKDKCVHLLISICSQLKHLLDQGAYAQAYELADAIHCLPTIMADNGLKVPKTYWTTFIKPYRNKWDKNFLKEEQKTLK